MNSLTRTCLAAGLLLAATTGSALAADPIRPLHCNDSTGVTLASGKDVTVVGVVTAQFSTEKTARLYLQDATGGVCVFGSPKNCAAIGDSLRVSGTVTSFNGLTEVAGTQEAPISIETLGRAARAALPLELSPGDLTSTEQPDGCEPNESRLVALRDVLVRMGSGAMPSAAAFAGGTSYRLVHAGADSTSNWAMMRVVTSTGCDSSSSLSGAPIPAGPVRVVGVLSQYLGRGATRGGYQLLPRMRVDVQPAGARGAAPAKP